MASKEKIKGFSKSTIGRSVETVSDYVDILSQMIAEYFNQKYKVKKKVEDIKKATMQTLYNLKREFMRSMVECILLTTGLLALIVGIILYLTRFVALEYILIVYGLVVTIIVLAQMKLKV